MNYNLPSSCKLELKSFIQKIKIFPEYTVMCNRTLNSPRFYLYVTFMHNGLTYLRFLFA